MQFLDRRKSAEYLSKLGVATTEQGLADKAYKGGGPRYAIINGRALYTEADLGAWVAAQAAHPVVRLRGVLRKHSQRSDLKQ